MIIDFYIQFIKNFELALKKKLKIKGDLWNQYDNSFPRNGAVDEYKYNLHGFGCRIELNDIVCEYDIAPLSSESIKFSVWKLFNFIETNSELENMNMDDVHAYILRLIENKIVSKLIVDNIDTGTFQIDSSYINNLLKEDNKSNSP